MGPYSQAIPNDTLWTHLRSNLRPSLLRRNRLSEGPATRGLRHTYPSHCEQAMNPNPIAAFFFPFRRFLTLIFRTMLRLPDVMGRSTDPRSDLQDSSTQR
jgi:hypothetical protein